MSVGKSSHKLLDIDEELQRGVCAQCGFTDLLSSGSRYVCAKAKRMRRKNKSTPSPLNPPSSRAGQFRDKYGYWPSDEPCRLCGVLSKVHKDTEHEFAKSRNVGILNG